MKICILSMQRVPNFGSILQGYSLKCILEDLGHEVDFIDIEEREEDDQYAKSSRKSYSHEYGVKSKSKLDRYLLNRLRNKRKNQKQKKIMQSFQDRIIKLRPENNSGHYDMCVIGSDEVFNAMNASEWGFTSQLFGNVPQADKVITYAASCGFTTYQDLPRDVISIIRESFKNISAFSVRDDNTRQFVKMMSKQFIDVHCDPVVIADFTEEASQQADVKGLPDRYCIVYAYHDRMNHPAEIAAIKKICHEHKMTPVSVGSSQFWIGRHMVLNPFQIPYVFAHADFVITDTFHGTIFSAKYSSRFAVLVRESNRNKLGDLLDKLRIGDHKLQDIKDMEGIYSIKHDKNTMHDIEKLERERALKYLETYCSENASVKYI